METFAKGDLVVTSIPFTDTIGTKARPAIVVAELEGNDLILCGVTSSRSDGYSLDLTNEDLEDGMLRVESMIRPNILFTIEKCAIHYKMGHLRETKIAEIERNLVEILTQRD